MYCRNCGSPMNPNLWVCERCSAENGFGNQFCPNCGNAVIPNSTVCNTCGCSLTQSQTQTQPQYQQTQTQYQQPQYQQPYHPQVTPPLPTNNNYNQYSSQYTNQPGTQPVMQQKSKTTAVLLALFLGGLGIHNFYLGYTTKAIIQLSIYLGSLVLMAIGIGFITIFIPGTWAFVEMILLLTGSIDRDGNNLPLSS